MGSGCPLPTASPAHPCRGLSLSLCLGPVYSTSTYCTLQPMHLRYEYETTCKSQSGVAFTRQRGSDRRGAGRPADAGARGPRQAAPVLQAYKRGQSAARAAVTARVQLFSQGGEDPIRSRRTLVLCWPRSGLSTRTRTRSVLRSTPRSPLTLSNSFHATAPSLSLSLSLVYTYILPSCAAYITHPGDTLCCCYWYVLAPCLVARNPSAGRRRRGRSRPEEVHLRLFVCIC